MSELATLGTRFTTEGAQTTLQQLDAYAQKAKAAGGASEAVAGGTRVLSASMQQVVESISRAEREMAEITQQERMMAQAAGAAATSTSALGQSMSTLAPTLSRVGKDAQVAVNHFDKLHDALQHDFAAQYAAQMGTVVRANDRANAQAKVLTQTNLNLSRQFADVGVQAAMGTNALMIAIMQGPQIADAFAQAKSQGVGFKDALSGMAKGAVGLVAAWGPVLAIAGAVAGAFILWRKHADDVKEAQERLATVSKRLAEGQNAVLTAFSSAASFAEKYAATNANLNKAIDGVIASQNTSYSTTMTGVGATDQATAAATRRAEVERILTVQLLEKAAVEAGVRAKALEDEAKAGQKTANRAGMWAGIGQAWMSAESPGAVDPLAVGDAARARQERELGVATTKKAAAAEREYEKALKDAADETRRMTLITPEAQQARSDAAKAGERDAKKAAEDAKRARQATADYITGLERELQAVGRTSEAVRRLAADREIEIALKRGDMDSAMRIKGLILETEKMEDLAKALEEVAKHRKVALEAANEPIFKMPQGVILDKPDVVAEMAREFEIAARAADEIRYAVDDIFWSIRDKNWAGAFAGLFNVIKQLQTAFDETASKSQRLGAVGGVLTGVGAGVGGKAGSAISSVGSGFSAASAVSSASATLSGMGGAAASFGGAISGLAGPIGIAVAGFSLLSSVLSSDKAAKRAKAEREAQDIQNARAAAQEQADKQAELQLRILELSGDEVGALTMKRQAEVAALKGANRALAEHAHALEDWAKAVGLAKDAVSKAETALRDAYNAERDRLNGVIGGVEKARDRLRDAYGRERGAIESTISSVRSLVDGFAAFRKELDMLAVANDPSRQYGYSQGQFAAATNDNLIERGRAFADASQVASATDLDFQRDLAAVRRRTDDAAATAQSQLSTAERQLLALDAMVAPLLGANDNLLSVDEVIRGLLTAEQEAALAVEELARLDAQVGALITINSSVLSVAQAINNLQGALGALAAAQAAKPAEGAAGSAKQVVGLTGYVDKNADLAALYASGAGMAKGRTKEEFAAYHWERYGQGEGRTYTAFAAGGDHTGGLRLVGEEGPELEATGPSRIFSAGQTAKMLGGDTARLEALVEKLTEELAELRKEQTQDNFEIKRNTKESADVLSRVSLGGDTLRTEEAA